MLGNAVLPSLSSSYVTVYSNAAFKSCAETTTYEFERWREGIKYVSCRLFTSWQSVCFFNLQKTKSRCPWSAFQLTPLQGMMANVVLFPHKPPSLTFLMQWKPKSWPIRSVNPKALMCARLVNATFSDVTWRQHVDTVWMNVSYREAHTTVMSRLKHMNLYNCIHLFSLLHFHPVQS